jgi:choline dehydrogenase-like flavoprotein
MIHDIHELEDNTALEADVCIIGLGVAGLAIAREFLGTRTRVIVVESGSWAIEAETSELNRGDVAGLPYKGMLEGRARAFGGTSNLWGGQCVPLDPIDFQQRSWVPFSGWPITRESLEPYYERAKDRLWIPADEYDDCVWARFGLDRVDFDPDILHIAHTIFIAKHNLGRRYRAELQSAPNIRVLLHANVTRLETNGYGTRAVSVLMRSLAGKCGRVSARIFVLCAGTIENARLLLLSSQVNPAGLGNDHDNVGRFLQDHPVCNCAEIKTDAPRLLQDHFNLLYSRAARTLRPGHGRKYLPKMALSEAVQRREQVLNCVGQLDYEFASGSPMRAVRDVVVALHMGRRPERLLATMGRVALASPLLASNAFRFLTRGLTPAVRPAGIYLQAISEQAPDRDSRITLNDDPDALGLQKAQVKWRLQDLDWRTFEVFGQAVQSEFARLGLGRVEIADWLVSRDFSQFRAWDNFHQAGTTRMGHRPTEGVVDEDCKIFGVEALYIAGNSVFPTSGSANPVLTIMATSIRLADTLKNRLRSSQDALAPAPA